MKLSLPLAICLSFLCFSFGNQQAPARCTYGTLQGRFDGKYVSYYPNGKKKAEGRFKNNYRDGKWLLWNQNGQLVAERNYINPFEFTQIYPRIPEQTPAHNRYKLERDNNRCYKQFSFTEDRILTSRKIWRFISPKENPFLFSADNRLFRVINEAVKNDGLKTYGNDALTITATPNETAPALQKIIGFKTTEEWLFDKDRLVSQYYTIALCPVAINTSNGDTTDLYWINTDQARIAMSKEYINDVPLPKHIETLDDILFFHYFYGQIYKEGNTSSEELYQLARPGEMEQAALKIDLSIIDNEHNTWLTIYK